MHAAFRRLVEGQDQLEVVHDYAHPTDKVWAALTTPERMTEWMGLEWLSKGPFRVGGPFDYRFKDTDIESHGHVLRLEPPRVFEHSWFENTPPPTTVRWALEPTDEGCRLTLTHRLPQPDDAPRTAAGWSTHLGALDAWLTGRPFQPAEDWRAMRDRYALQFGPDATRDGRVIEIDGQTALRFERLLHKSVGRVWTAITTPAGIKGWLQAEAEIEPRPGGRMHLNFLAVDHRMTGEVLTFDPPNTFAFTWPEPWAGEGSTVRIDLQPDGADRCLLTLTHHLPKADDLAGFASGWHWHLDGVEAAADGIDTAWNDARWRVLQQMYQMTLA